MTTQCSATLPEVVVDAGRIRQNYIALKRLLDAQGVELVPVTKVFAGCAEIAELFVEAGARMLADSRLQNLRAFAHLPAEKMLLRSPGPSEVDEAIRWADVSLVADLSIAKRLAKAALAQGLTHRLILMIELGDLREGIYELDEALEAARQINHMKGVQLLGLGTNFACLAMAMPTADRMHRLYSLSRAVREAGINLHVLSLGNSANFNALGVPRDIGVPLQLRVGEAIVFGRETMGGTQLPGTHYQTVILRAEIIELHRKPSELTEAWPDSSQPRRLRAICAMGHQDVPASSLTPLDKKLAIVGATSDHLVLDMQNSPQAYRVGSIVEFSLDYKGVLGALTSRYVATTLVNR